MENTKYAFAFELRVGEQIAFGQRQFSKDEYPGWWSLPSTSIARELFESTSQDGVLSASETDKILNRKLGFTCGLPAYVLGRSVRKRSGYLLRMLLLSLSPTKEIPASSAKYQSVRLLTIQELLKLTDGRVSTCVSTLLQSLAETEQIAPDPTILELSPMLAESAVPVDQLAPAELWRQAAPNFELLIKGELGGDGHLIRASSIDRHIRTIIDRLSPTTTILDLGCGDGNLIRYMRSRGLAAKGLDVNVSDEDELSGNFFRGSIFDSSQIFGGQQFSLLILNLVVEWLPDLDQLLASIKALAAPESTVLVTLQPPEFTKNGRWLLTSRPEMVIYEPIRRQPLLTMLNRGVGPVWYYPHSTPDIISAFGRAGFGCVRSEYIFLDGYLTESEKRELLRTKPYLRRLVSFPIFLSMEFRN